MKRMIRMDYSDFELSIEQRYDVLRQFAIPGTFNYEMIKVHNLLFDINICKQVTDEEYRFCLYSNDRVIRKYEDKLGIRVLERIFENERDKQDI